MSKRIRRDCRRILCDSEEIARSIERYCLDNGFVEGEFTKCLVESPGTRLHPKWTVVFYCTLDQWNRIEKHYDLVRLKTVKYHLNYKMRT